jgi:hypothetical protein
MRHRICWLLVLFCICCFPAFAEEPAAHEVLQEIRASRLDPGQIYKVRELNIYREELRIYLLDGTLAFLEPVRGKVTGAVFIGQGEVLLIPPDAVERRNLAAFIKSPVLDETFSSALLRFTDETASQLRSEIARSERAEPVEDQELLRNWNPVVANLHNVHEMRVLTDLLARKPVPFFSARVSSDHHGIFDIVLDYRQAEQLLLGQVSTGDERRFNDIWCSFAVRSVRSRPGGFEEPLQPQRYRIESRILPSRVMQVSAEVDLRPALSGERMFGFYLSRNLQVSSVQLLRSGTPPVELEFYQSAWPEERERYRRGNDQVMVALPAPSVAGQAFTLRFQYEGEVISNSGNGVMYVGDRGNWYPRCGTYPTRFEMKFYCPRKQTLIATGDRLEDREEGEWRVSRWTSPVPLVTAGFNLGEYEKGEVRLPGLQVEAYMNRSLEPELAAENTKLMLLDGGRITQRTTATGTVPIVRPPTVVTVSNPVPSAADLAGRMARDTAQNLEYFTRLFGSLPLRRIAVSPIPGNFGQGWPGLIYLSTRSYLLPFTAPSVASTRSTAARANEIYLGAALCAHELAHQWWGNLVPPASYRDEWLIESLANYSALMYLTARRGEQPFRLLLNQYRDELLQKVDGEPAEQAGPPVLGIRLNTSLHPNGVDLVMYKKGTWVIHMLRQLMSDPKTGSDARFLSFLRSLADTFNLKPLSTERFREMAERFVIPAANLEGKSSLEWFFDQWVYSTGVPEVRVKSSIEKKAGKIQVEGTVVLSGVSDYFGVPVPIYAQTARGQVLLGVVSAIGKETPFQFPVVAAPQKVLADPQDTLLAQMK